MFISASVKLTVAIFSFGSSVNNVLSEEESNSVVSSSKSDVIKLDDGSFPFTTPVTVVTPVTVILDDVTDTTLAVIGSSDIETSEYCNRLSTFISPGNSLLELVIVLIPLLSNFVTDATPMVAEGVCTTFALKVLIPTILLPLGP